jgi:hypothetical protein
MIKSIYDKRNENVHENSVKGLVREQQQQRGTKVELTVASALVR